MLQHWRGRARNAATVALYVGSGGMPLPDSAGSRPGLSCDRLASAFLEFELNRAEVVVGEKVPYRIECVEDRGNCIYGIARPQSDDIRIIRHGCRLQKTKMSHCGIHFIDGIKCRIRDGHAAPAVLRSPMAFSIRLFARISFSFRSLGSPHSSTSMTLAPQ